MCLCVLYGNCMAVDKHLVSDKKITMRAYQMNVYFSFGLFFCVSSTTMWFQIAFFSLFVVVPTESVDLIYRLKSIDSIERDEWLELF